MPIGTSRYEAARETDSAHRTRPRVWAPPKAEDHGPFPPSSEQNPPGPRKWLVDEIVSV